MHDLGRYPRRGIERARVFQLFENRFIKGVNRVVYDVTAGDDRVGVRGLSGISSARETD
jgi:hypothetical protein